MDPPQQSQITKKKRNRKKKNKSSNQQVDPNNNSNNPPNPSTVKLAAPTPKPAALKPAPNPEAPKSSPKIAAKPAAPKTSAKTPVKPAFNTDPNTTAAENLATKLQSMLAVHSDEDDSDEDVYQDVKNSINFRYMLTNDGEFYPHPNYRPEENSDSENFDDFDDFEHYDNDHDDAYDAENTDIYPDKVKNDWRTYISAVRKNDIEFVKKFIRCGGDVNYPKDPQGALHCAAYFGFTELLTLLLNAPNCNVNLQDEDGDTPLHTAIGEKASNEVISILLEKGAAIHIPNKAGRTPLDYANLTKNNFVLKIDDSASKLCEMVEAGNLQQVTDYLRTHKLYINHVSKDGLTPLHEAALNGDAKIAALLIENGALVNSLSQLGAAALSTPLHCASTRGNLEVAKLLIEKGASVDPKNLQGQAPIHCAAAQNQPDMVKLLVASSCDVNILNSGRLLALHYAIMDKMVDTVQLLLENGCNANHPSAMTPPILYANMFPGAGTLQIVKLLVKHGAVVSPKVLSAFSGNKEITEFLSSIKK